MSDPPLVTPAPWASLHRYTDARIALGRAGHSLPTAAHLAFQLAHAQARDAVHLDFDALGLAQALQDLGLETLLLHSAAPDRASYLQRPELGRRLDEAARRAIGDWCAAQGQGGQGRYDLAFVVADGLSALGVHNGAVALIAATLARLRADAARAWRIAPVALVAQGRVAVGDEVGERLGADAVVVLIGERPGLSSPDSLGLYLSWAPRVGLSDAQRNCISNVRPAGLSSDAAAGQLQRLLILMRERRLSGVGLKDEGEAPVLASSAQASFLLAPPGEGEAG